MEEALRRGEEARLRDPRQVLPRWNLQRRWAGAPCSQRLCSGRNSQGLGVLPLTR